MAPNPKTPAMLAVEEISRKRQIKEEASRRILAFMPQWKQANLTARMVELLRKQLTGNALTTEEAAELEFGDTVFEKIKAVRAHSNALEADPDAGPWPELS